MEALRRELGADLSRIAAPEGRDIAEAFFRKTPPRDFAWHWMQDCQGRRQQAPNPAASQGDDGTLTLF